MSGSQPDLAVLFDRLRGGDAEAREALVGALYTELHALAARRMRQETGRHTLQATALVNEAYLRLMRGPEIINDRQHFFALAAQAMRRVLVDYARQKRSGKRGGDRERVTLELVPGQPAVDVDLVALDDALRRLAALDAQAARVVELRFFGGHTDKEVCAILDEKLPTVRRHWVFARSFLRHHLTPEATA